MVCETKDSFGNNNKHGRLIFLTENILVNERQKVSALISHANNAISEYFGVVTSFDIIICYGSWEMEVQVISREGGSRWRTKSASDDNIRRSMQKSPRVIINSVGLTDYCAGEIIIRHDSAGYGHYLHELIHGVISKDHTHQLREGLAWYFTFKLTENHKYVRPPHPSWVDHLYVFPVKELARIVGDGFLKDFALGRGSLDVELLPSSLQDLFLPEGLFYAKKRYFRR
ncbi:MAG TPA: hypothetical protein VHA09_08840 [Nitrososphaera sp.]|nr:hypothetical protein [Nitrososphaera sp.]